MNIVIAALYGFTIWLSCLSYAMIVGWRWGLVAVAMPLYVSGASAAILFLDWTIRCLVNGIRKMIRTA